MNKIKIGTIEMPTGDYAVGATAVLGIRDSGKTVTSKGIAEQLIEQHVHVVVFDAVGKWRWMRTTADKHGRAYRVVVAGGKAPDLPLTPHSVGEIVRGALKERIPLVIDLFDRNLSKADWRRIVKDAIRIIHYENDEGAVHVFLEEAAEFIPQRVIDGDVYAEVEKLVRMGGNNSVGITLINQRSQEVNKAVLDQCTTLILGCQVGNKAIEAVGKWVERLDPDTSDRIATSLPRLKAGQAWVWTRQNPDRPSLEQMPMCRSYHPDRRTPESVLKSIQPADTSDFIARLSAAIPKVVEEAKANDPAELKREIARLKKLVGAVPLPSVERVEVPVLNDHDKAILNNVRTVVAECHKRADAIQETMGRMIDACDDVAESVKEKLFEGNNSKPSKTGGAEVRSEQPMSAPTPRRPGKFEFYRYGSQHPELSGLTRMERAFLTVLAQHSQGLTKGQILTHACYSASGPTSKAFAELLRRNYVVPEMDGLRITQPGLLKLGNFNPLPTGAALQSHVLSKMNRMEGALLSVLCEAFPSTLVKGEILKRANYAASGPTSKAFARLLRLGYVVQQGRELAASEILFD